MKSQTQEIMVVRHPQTVANASGRYIGRTNSPITPVGQAQVRWLAHVVGAWRPQVTFTSPLPRAAETARAITPQGVRVDELPDLQEIDFGDAEGRTFAELAELGIHMDYETGGPIVPGGERADAFHERVRRAGSAIRADGGRALVVTHGGVMRHLLAFWLDLPFSASWRFVVTNASLAVVRLSDGHGVLEALTPPPEDPAHGGGHPRPWLR